MITHQAYKLTVTQKISLALVIGLSSMLALAPLALVIGWPLLAIALGFLALIVAYFTLGAFETHTGYRPNIAEHTLAGIDAVFVPAFVGLIWIAAYYLLYGAVGGVAYLINIIGTRVSWNTAAIAFYPTTLLFSVLVGAVIANTTTEIAAKLFPETAGVRSAYFQLFTTGRRRFYYSIVGAILVLLALAGLFALTQWSRTWLYIGLQLYLYFGSASLALSEELQGKLPEPVEITTLVGEMFQAVGYEVELNPRTQDTGVDPLLVDLDLLAHKEDQYIFVKVETPSSSEKALDFKAPSMLKQAAWVLSQKRAYPTQNAEARLILVDIPIDEKLIKFSNSQSVPVINLSNADIDELISLERDERDLADAARRLLDLTAEAKLFAQSAV